eukprot:gene10283-11343_t
MSSLSEDLEEGKPWVMLFAGDLALCGDQTEELEERLEECEWRKRLEEVGLKVSRAKRSICLYQKRWRRSD